MSPTERIARFAGWSYRDDLRCWVDPEGTLWLRPTFTTLADWRPVWEEIERRGLQDRYEEAFHATTGHFAEEWEFLTATTEQRIEAMCRMLDRIEGETTNG